MTVPQGVLEWRCRRGALELDTLMLRYLRRRYPIAPAHERAAFARLLEFPDPVLFDLLVRRTGSGEQEIAYVIERILADPGRSA